MCMECPQTPAVAGLSESVTRVSGGATWESSFLVRRPSACLLQTQQHQNLCRGGGPEPGPRGTWRTLRLHQVTASWRFSAWDLRFNLSNSLKEFNLITDITPNVTDFNYNLLFDCGPVLPVFHSLFLSIPWSTWLRFLFLLQETFLSLFLFSLVTLLIAGKSEPEC